MGSCEHPYEALEIEPAPNVRGTVPVIRITCGECKSPVSGNGGLVLFLMGMREDLGRLFKAIIELGAELAAPAVKDPALAKVKGECPHFLGWLEVAGDRSPTRGHASLSSARCVNCNKTWPDCMVLLVVMKKEIDKLWIEIRKLKARS